MAVKPRFFEDRDSLFDTLAAEVASDLTQAVSSRGRAGLVVSGGSTPGPLFSRLAEADAPWSGTMVTLADERWVPPEDAASNEGLLRRTLLTQRAAAARFIPLYTDHDTPDQGYLELTRRLNALPQPLDVVLLGMGDDGHTASLFPDASDLHLAMNPRSSESCAPIHAPSAKMPRMTLTYAALLHSRRIVVLSTGQSKRDVFEAAAKPDANYPISAFFNQNRTPIHFYWAP